MQDDIFKNTYTDMYPERRSSILAMTVKLSAIITLCYFTIAGQIFT